VGYLDPALDLLLLLRPIITSNRPKQAPLISLDQMTCGRMTSFRLASFHDPITHPACRTSSSSNSSHISTHLPSRSSPCNQSPSRNLSLL
jgi:hypothetical protein